MREQIVSEHQLPSSQPAGADDTTGYLIIVVCKQGSAGFPGLIDPKTTGARRELPGPMPPVPPYEPVTM